LAFPPMRRNTAVDRLQRGATAAMANFVGDLVVGNAPTPPYSYVESAIAMRLDSPLPVLADPPQSVRQRLVGDWLVCFTLAPREKPFIICVILFVPFSVSLQHRSHPFVEVNVRVV